MSFDINYGWRDKPMNKGIVYLGLIGSLFVTGCGEVQVYDVDTKFSNVIQVEPVSKGRRTVF